jgi:hypothetical protein
MFLRHSALYVLRDALQLLNEQQHFGGSHSWCRRHRRCYRRSSGGGNLRLNGIEPCRDIRRRGGRVRRSRGSHRGSLDLRYEVARLSWVQRLRLLKAGLGRKRLMWLLLIRWLLLLLLLLLHVLLLVHLLLWRLLLLLLISLRQRLLLRLLLVHLLRLLPLLLLLLLLLLLCVASSLTPTQPVHTRLHTALHPALILLLIHGCSGGRRVVHLRRACIRTHLHICHVDGVERKLCASRIDPILQLAGESSSGGVADYAGEEVAGKVYTARSSQVFAEVVKVSDDMRCSLRQVDGVRTWAKCYIFS